MRNAIESDSRYKELKADYDANGLLDLIKEKVYGADEKKEPLWLTAEAMNKLHFIYQHPSESHANFHKRFDSQVEMTESVWGPLIPQNMKGKPTEAQEKARKAYIARLFLHRLNKRYHGVVNELSKAYMNGRNEYPEDLSDALTWITNQTVPASDAHGDANKSNKTSSNGANDDGAPRLSSFTQLPEPANATTTTLAMAQTDTPHSTISISRAQYERRRPLSGFRGVSFAQLNRAEDSSADE